MARSTMATMIANLRGLAQAGTADYAVGTVNYWSDDQLQDKLDAHRQDIYRAPMQPIQVYKGGAVEYHDYHSGYINLETTSGGTAIFYVEDAAGSAVGTALYTPDYNRGVVTFTADTGGSAYYLYGRSYDLNAAAADVWRTKAGHYATAVNFSTDNHRIDRGEIIKNCLQMAGYYSQQAGASNVVILRGDNAN